MTKSDQGTSREAGLCYQVGKWPQILWDRARQGKTGQGPEGDLRRKGYPEGVTRGFGEDLFSRMYLPVDPAKKEGGGQPDWAVQFHSEGPQTQEWQRLKRSCGGSPLLSALAAESLMQGLVKEIPEKKEQDGDRKESEKGGEGREGENGTGGTGDQARRAVRVAARAAQEKVEEAKETLESLQGILPGKGGDPLAGDISPDEMARGMEALKQVQGNQLLKKILDMAGRLKRLALARKRQRIVSGQGEVHGVEMGGDLDRLLPVEMTLLGSEEEELEMIGLARVIERKAMQYSLRGKETEHRGDAVVLVDMSGSMSSREAHVWAKAVAVAVAAGKAREGRKTWLVLFNNVVAERDVIEIGPGTSTSDLFQVLGRTPSGGTSFDRAGEKAMALLAESHRKACDVLWITDGEDNLDSAMEEKILAHAKGTGTSHFAIGIGCMPKALAKLCSKMIRVRAGQIDDAVADTVNLSS